MNLTPSQKAFLDMIRDTCIEECSIINMKPSVLVAIAVIVSNWGMDKSYLSTNNVFLLPANTKDGWYGKCYSKNTSVVYSTPDDCTENGTILYRFYDHPRDAIRDFVQYFTSARKTSISPLMYQFVLEATDYKDAVGRLRRSEFFQRYMHQGNEMGCYNTLIAIIENNEFYKFDEEAIEMSRKKNRLNLNRTSTSSEVSIADEVIITTTNDEDSNESAPVIVMDHMYRVRLDWEKPDTQIFASPNFEDAKVEALKHEGYKIYIDDDGELFTDPWINLHKKEEEKKISCVDVINYPVAGKEIILDKTPVYRKAIDKTVFGYFSGTFYYYDSLVVNGKAKITKNKDNVGTNPSTIFGYISIKE